MEAKPTEGFVFCANGGSNLAIYSQSHGIITQDGKQLIAGVFGDVVGGENQAKLNGTFLAASWNSYQRNCPHPLEAAEGDLLGEALAKIRDSVDRLIDTADHQFWGDPSALRTEMKIIADNLQSVLSETKPSTP